MPVFGIVPAIILTPSGGTKCWGVDFQLGSDVPDPGMVNEGTRCDVGKVIKMFSIYKVKFLKLLCKGIVFFSDYKRNYVQYRDLGKYEAIKTKIKNSYDSTIQISYVITCGFHVAMCCAFFPPLSMSYNLLVSLPLLGHPGDYQGRVYACVCVLRRGEGGCMCIHVCLCTRNLSVCPAHAPCYPDQSCLDQI